MTGKLSRRQVNLLLATAASGIAAPAIIAHAGEKVSFAMGAGAFYFTVHYVAEAGGLYAAEGLTLDSVNVSSGPRQTAAVMGGAADAAPLGLQLVVQAAQHAGNIVAVCAGYNILPMSILLSNDAIARNGIALTMSTDEKVKRLRGLKIGITTPGSGTDDMVRALLRKRGMDPDRDVTIQPLVNAEGMLAALERGATDGFCFTSPILELAVSRKLGQIVLEPLNGDVPEANNVPYIILSTNHEAIANKRPMLLAMVRCWTKAMDLVRADPAEASKLVHRYFPDVEQSIYDAAYKIYQQGVPTTPMVTAEQTENVVNFMKISKGVPVSANYADVFYPGIAEEVLKTRGKT
ncbi:MAG: ABC transporter substrate-binding protein [Acidobacteriota bacterium]